MKSGLRVDTPDAGASFETGGVDVYGGLDNAGEVGFDHLDADAGPGNYGGFQDGGDGVFDDNAGEYDYGLQEHENKDNSVDD